MTEPIEPQEPPTLETVLALLKTQAEVIANQRIRIENLEQALVLVRRDYLETKRTVYLLDREASNHRRCR